MKKRFWIFLIYILLFALSIPWYFSDSAPVRLWLGLPHWVIVSLLAIVATAIFTVLAINFIWPEDNNSPGQEQ